MDGVFMRIQTNKKQKREEDKHSKREKKVVRN